MPKTIVQGKELKWAAPEFLEQAAGELIERRSKVATTEKVPTPSELQASPRRLG